MEERAMTFNENQLKRTGFAEAFTPELKLQMERGLPEIAHPFKKEYDGDRVEATLHLKKSATTDFYFLNKFDLRLQKEGQANAIAQTFYLTQRKPAQDAEDGSTHRLENKYTLKEAYNLLAGRPVFKDLVNQEGHEYQAWVKLNFKNTMNNGNYEMKQYHTNYGFDLEKTLGHYPIKELTNPQYKVSLMDSLHRGNLQKSHIRRTERQRGKAVHLAEYYVWFLERVRPEQAASADRNPGGKTIHREGIGGEIDRASSATATAKDSVTAKRDRRSAEGGGKKKDPNSKARKRKAS